MRNKTVRKIVVQCQKCWSNGGKHMPTALRGPKIVPCRHCAATGLAAVPLCELKGAGEIEKEEARRTQGWRHDIPDYL